LKIEAKTIDDTFVFSTLEMTEKKFVLQMRWPMNLISSYIPDFQDRLQQYRLQNYRLSSCE
jgi:hypothetical protein